MKILVIDKYEGIDNMKVERHICFCGSKEGEYYRSEKGGINAKIKDIRNGELHFYGSYCCTGALTKYGVIQEMLGGNGYVEGYIPNITVKDLESNITWTVADYMKRHGLTKLNGGIVVGEQIYNDIYNENVDYVDRGVVVANNGWREMLAVMRKRMTVEQLKERGIIFP